jgi:kumamolisin
VGGGDANYLVPPSSVPSPMDAGVRAHTNHIIFAGATARIGGPSGLTPSQVRGAYGNNGAGSDAIAIVDAFNYPTALNDFNVFSAAFGLPVEPSASPTASTNTVFQVVYASGSKPADDPEWAQEAALDTQWAHAMAPGAKIYLVEAASNNMDDMMAAVNVAKSLPNVRQVSMSFGTQESGCTFVRYNSALRKSGVTFFAAAGDSAGERDFPAESYHAVAVGGTSLSVGPTGQWLAEAVWSSTGCGPSSYEPRPVFQDPLYPRIGTHRAAVDIAAVGDPNTGVSVYDSTPSQGVSGWIVLGGTSASCPIIAGCVNAAGIADVSSQALNARFYSGIGSSSLHDITIGSAGPFAAMAGWDFPSGVGTPNDLSGLGGG